MEPGIVALVVITFLAAFVNGALGYGFSSITVPVGLLFGISSQSDDEDGANGK